MTMTSGSVGCSVRDEVEQVVRLRGALDIPAALPKVLSIDAAAGQLPFDLK